VALRSVLVRPTSPVHTDSVNVHFHAKQCVKGQGVNCWATLRGGTGVISRQRKIIENNVAL
jgi:hypothetical protein